MNTLTKEYRQTLNHAVTLAPVDEVVHEAMAAFSMNIALSQAVKDHLSSA